MEKESDFELISTGIKVYKADLRAWQKANPHASFSELIRNFLHEHVRPLRG